MEHNTFAALIVSEDTEHKAFSQVVGHKQISELPANDVLIKVRYSSLNYKDALSATGNRGVTRHYPHTPGIDAAGEVIHSDAPQWQIGAQVICTGYDLGMNTSGGFGQYIRVPGEWIVPKPAGLTLHESMQSGTAGFTAALCVLGLRDNGVTPDKGPVLITGATGGVGSITLLLLHRLGYDVVAMTGKSYEHPFLFSLGAKQIISRSEFLADQDKQLLPARWAGAVDTVGGNILATVIKGTGYDGVVTSCGNAASGDLPLNVYPFILRGVHLVGIYSAHCPMEKRLRAWDKLAGAWKIPKLAAICRTVSLRGLKDEIAAMIAGNSKGRCVVDLEESE
jgi:acrylyl-CoA reductase (NADPH)